MLCFHFKYVEFETLLYKDDTCWSEIVGFVSYKPDICE